MRITEHVKKQWQKGWDCPTCREVRHGVGITRKENVALRGGKSDGTTAKIASNAHEVTVNGQAYKRSGPSEFVYAGKAG